MSKSAPNAVQSGKERLEVGLLRRKESPRL